MLGMAYRGTRTATRGERLSARRALALMAATFLLLTLWPAAAAAHNVSKRDARASLNPPTVGPWGRFFTWAQSTCSLVMTT